MFLVVVVVATGLVSAIIGPVSVFSLRTPGSDVGVTTDFYGNNHMRWGGERPGYYRAVAMARFVGEVEV
jgi:hypothetical protein